MTTLSKTLNPLPTPPPQTYIDTSIEVNSSILCNAQALCDTIIKHGPLVMYNNGIIRTEIQGAPFFILDVGKDTAQDNCPYLAVLESTDYVPSQINNLDILHYETKPLKQRHLFTIHFQNLRQGFVFAPVSPKLYGEAFSVIQIANPIITEVESLRNALRILGKRIYRVFMKIHNWDSNRAVEDMRRTLYHIDTGHKKLTPILQVALAAAWDGIGEKTAAFVFRTGKRPKETQ